MAHMILESVLVEVEKWHFSLLQNILNFQADYLLKIDASVESSMSVSSKSIVSFLKVSEYCAQN